MRCIKIQNKKLVLGKCPKPSPKVDEVLIRVKAAGLNRPDIMQRMGLYPPPAGASEIPGLEIAGIIEETGKDAKEFKKGDRVVALLTGGGYADYATADHRQVLPLPSTLSFIEGAAIPETFFTVWSNVFERCHLQKGETLLVHGGSSGIGTTSILLGKAFGSQVIVTAGSDKKCAFCKRLGADLAINYNTHNFAEVIKNQLGKGAVNVVLDMVGGDYVSRNIELLGTEGRYCFIAFQKGKDAHFNIWDIMAKRLVLTGSTLRARSAEFKGSIRDQLYSKVWPLIEKGLIKPPIDKTFSLEDADKAHTYMESGNHMGKITLTLEET